MMKVMKHNSDVVQMGFYKNDIWLETLRSVVADVAETVDEMCRDTSIRSRIRMNEKGQVDLESYWQDANETVKAAMEAENEKKPADGTPAEPLIERDDDEKPIIFGGDHEGGECTSECEEAEERDGGGEGHHEVRDETDSMPEVSEPSGADATA